MFSRFFLVRFRASTLEYRARGSAREKAAHLYAELFEGVPSPEHLHGHAFLQQVHVLQVAAPKVVHLSQRQETGRLAG